VCSSSSCSSRVDLSRGQCFAAGGLSDHPCRGTGLSVCGPDCPPRNHGLSAWHQLLADRPRPRYGWSVFRGVGLVVLLRLTDCLPVGSGPSARCPRTVHPQARRPSAWHCVGLLSPLLLELCFRFGIVRTMCGSRTSGWSLPGVMSD
jgi:hypothetical protein